MKSLRHRVLVIAALALAAVCASAISASAQAGYRGSFTLTHEVRWQQAKLPAGDYSFEIRSLTMPATMTVKGPNGSQFVTAVVVDQKASDRSMLIVENRNGSFAISELRLANIGRVLHYATPKAPKDVELAQITREQVLVALIAK
jgi:hypothetical protein